MLISRDFVEELLKCRYNHFLGFFVQNKAITPSTGTTKEGFAEVYDVEPQPRRVKQQACGKEGQT